jgi:hypothetical protein
MLCSVVHTHLYPCFGSHLCSHSNLPGSLTDGNAWADNLVSGLAHANCCTRRSCLSHALYHQNASALCRQFHLSREQAWQIIISMPPHTLVRPLSMSSLIVWLCRFEGMFVFFLKAQNTQCGYHHGLSSFKDPLVPKMRRLRLEDSPALGQGALRLTLPLTRGWPRKWPLVREMWDSEPPTWGQIKKLMDMVMTVTSSLGMAENPIATLLVALVIITIQLSIVQGGWCILDFHAQPVNGASYHLAEPPYTYLYQWYGA